MDNSLLIGLSIGMIAGACVASNFKGARKAITDAQDMVASKLSPKKGECDCDCGCENTQEQF